MRPARRVGRALAVAIGLLVSSAAPVSRLGAQGTEAPALEVVPGPTGQGPTVRAVGLLDDAELQDLVRNGFPARLAFRVELFSAGPLVNEFEGRAAWEVIVRHDPVGAAWVVTRLDGGGNRVLGRVPRWADAAALAADGGTVPLVASKQRRHYYLAKATLEVLSLSDLAEAERWLRGDVRPAVRGEKAAGSAVGRFFRAVAARLLGSERRTVEGQSPTFVP